MDSGCMVQYNPAGESKPRSKPTVVTNPLVDVLVNLSLKRENATLPKHDTCPLRLPSPHQNSIAHRRLKLENPDLHHQHSRIRINTPTRVGISTPLLSRNNPHPNRVRHIKGLNGVPICAVHDDTRLLKPSHDEDMGFPFPPPKPPLSPKPQHVKAISSVDCTTGLPNYGFKEKAVPGIGICPVIHGSWKRKLKGLIGSLDKSESNSERKHVKPPPCKIGIRLPKYYSPPLHPPKKSTVLSVCGQKMYNPNHSAQRPRKKDPLKASNDAKNIDKVCKRKKWSCFDDRDLPSPKPPTTDLQRCRSFCSPHPKLASNPVPGSSRVSTRTPTPFPSSPSRVSNKTERSRASTPISRKSIRSCHSPFEPVPNNNHVVVYPDNETIMMEILALILQTDSIPAIQQWLISAGDRERNFVVEIIKTAIDEECNKTLEADE